jgi:hypothetical protein
MWALSIFETTATVIRRSCGDGLVGLAIKLETVASIPLATIAVDNSVGIENSRHPRARRFIIVNSFDLFGGKLV